MAIDPDAYSAVDLKAATPDSSVPSSALIFGADSQSADAPSVYPLADLANALPFTQSGEGVVARTVQDKLRDFVSVLDFGAIGDGVTDDAAAFQEALNSGKAVRVPPGAYGIGSPLVLPRGGASLIGDGELGFWSSVIRPLSTFSGDALFIADGDNEPDGWAFRNRLSNLLIWCDRVDAEAMPVVIRLNKAYTVFLESLSLNDVPGVGVHLTGNNYVNLHKCQLGGRNNATSPYGILCESDDEAGGGVFIGHCDIENFAVGVAQQSNAKVTLLSPYMEVNGIGWVAEGDSDGQMTVLGGRISGINASTHCASIKGDNVTVLGGSYSPNGGGGITTSETTSRKANVQILGVPPSIFSPYRNLYQKHDSSDVLNGWIEYTATTSKTLTSAVEEPLFTVTCPYAPGEVNNGFFEVDVYALLSNNDAVAAKATYTFCFANGGLTPVAESAKSEFIATDNWSLALVANAGQSGATITFSLTGTSGGFFGAEADIIVAAKARVIARNGNGDIYLLAV